MNDTLPLPAQTHNLLETYFQDGDNVFHYNALKAADNVFTYRVSFTRTVTESGINTTVTSVAGNYGAPVDNTITAALAAAINTLQSEPRSGEECQALKWTYLGHKRDRADAIQSAIETAAALGYSYKSLFYSNGYFVYGCAGTKCFYDQG
jgi:hypothetical protein